MKKPLPPSQRVNTQIMPPATAEQKAHVDAFIACIDTYCETFLIRTQKIRLANRPPFLQAQIEQNKQWRKLCNLMRAMNRQRRVPPLTLDDLVEQMNAEAGS